MGVRVVLEVAPKRAFASALDWPGWARAGRTEEEALEALLAYAPRYAAVTRRAKVSFDPPSTRGGVEVVERVTGGGGTEFGVPGVSAAEEADPILPAQLKRMLSLLRATWASFDAASRSADGVTLRVGPRGGGRQVPKIAVHVREAEAAYLASLGSRPPEASDETSERSMKLLRAAFANAITARATGRPVPNANRTRTLWSPRYAVRRAAWHVLDHAWEIEDRSG